MQLAIRRYTIGRNLFLRYFAYVKSMFCPSCGSDVKPDYAFCNKCGASLSPFKEQLQQTVPTALTGPAGPVQPVQPALLLKEPIGFKKSGEWIAMKGDLELYEDCLNLRIAPGFGNARVPLGSGQTIPFSHITSLNGVQKSNPLWKSVQIEIRTDLGVTWEITGDERVYGALQSSIQTWRGRGLRSS